MAQSDPKATLLATGLKTFKYTYRCMQIEDIYTIGSELLQTGVELLSQDVRLVDTRCIRIDFRCDRRSSVLPARLSCESLLLAPNVGTSSIDLIVARGLKVIEKGVVLGKRCNSSASIGIRSKGHKTKDDSGLCALREERHFGLMMVDR